MDPSIPWFQPEQEGPAKHLWLRIWQTELEFDSMNLKDNDSDTESSFPNGLNHHHIMMNGKTDNKNSSTTTTTFGQRRRKGDNRSNTKLMGRQPQRIIGDFGGCSWRRDQFVYSRGVIG